MQVFDPQTAKMVDPDMDNPIHRRAVEAHPAIVASEPLPTDRRPEDMAGLSPAEAGPVIAVNDTPPSEVGDVIGATMVETAADAPVDEGGTKRTKRG